MKKILLLIFGLPIVGLGCSCSQASVEESASWADVVFSGRVQKTEPHPREKEVMWLYVVPDKQWKGPELKGPVKIWYHKTCGMRPANGRVIIYAQAILDYHHTGTCARTSFTAKDSEELNRLFKK